MESFTGIIDLSKVAPILGRPRGVLQQDRGIRLSAQAPFLPPRRGLSHAQSRSAATENRPPIDPSSW